MIMCCLLHVNEDECRWYPTDCYTCDWFWYESPEVEEKEIDDEVHEKRDLSDNLCHSADCSCVPGSERSVQFQVEKHN